MKIHITNLYGRGDTIGKAQQMTADIAKKDLNYNELGIYNYPMQSDTPDMLRTRLDGIVASVSHGDIVIFQLPTWNGFKFDETFVTHFNGYRNLKKNFLFMIFLRCRMREFRRIWINISHFLIVQI